MLSQRDAEWKIQFDFEIQLKLMIVISETGFWQN